MDAENTENMSEEHLIQAYTTEQDVKFHVFSENGFDSSLISCCFVVGGESLCKLWLQLILHGSHSCNQS